MMDLEIKRKEKREELVLSMARKLAIGNGEKIIAAGKRRKKFKKTKAVALGVLMFLITGVLIYLHIPQQVRVTPELIREIQEQRNPISRLYADFGERSISPDQYVLYLSDILIRYDSLPEKYKIDMPYIKASDVYDSMCTVWPLVNLRVRYSLQKLLPNLEKRLNEHQFKYTDIPG